MKWLASSILLVSASCFVGACTDAPQSEGCTSDSECDPGLFCDTSNGACRCRTDDACGENKYCNPFGACQDRPACRGNQDCDSGLICNSADPSGGRCIPTAECGSSVHCDFGNYCDPNAHVCKPGCRSTGDCQLGDVCVAGACTSGATANDCSLCPVNPDPDARYCDYGERCTNAGTCTAHPQRADLCSTCGQTTTCANGLICLVDDAVQNGNYCAPVCNIDADCPSGYEGCGSLQLVVEECTGSGSCSNGGQCLTAAEGTRGFCECIDQGDCDFYESSMLCMFGSCWLGDGRACTRGLDCACQGGRCFGTDFPCSSNDDCAIECVQVEAGDDTIGICQTKAKACGKGSGVTCQELTSGTPDCREF